MPRGLLLSKILTFINLPIIQEIGSNGHEQQNTNKFSLSCGKSSIITISINNHITTLLSEKNYNQISVQEIIDAADVGRTTFYAHFETKDYLLKDLCEELFGHIIDTAMGLPHGHYHYSCGNTTDSVFLHLLRYLQENDRHILELLSSQNNDLFLRYFKSNLKKIIISQYAEKGQFQNSKLPEDYLVNHITSSFVETISWWLSHNMEESPEQITEYFIATIEPML